MSLAALRGERKDVYSCSLRASCDSHMSEGQFSGPSSKEEQAENYPVDENLKQLAGKTIYKTEKWWKAAVLSEGWGKKALTVYLWQFRNGDWKVVQKYKIHRKDEWAKDKETIEALIEKL